MFGCVMIGGCVCKCGGVLGVLGRVEREVSGVGCIATTERLGPGMHNGMDVGGGNGMPVGVLVGRCGGWAG